MSKCVIHIHVCMCHVYLHIKTNTTVCTFIMIQIQSTFSQDWMVKWVFVFCSVHNPKTAVPIMKMFGQIASGKIAHKQVSVCYSSVLYVLPIPSIALVYIYVCM